MTLLAPTLAASRYLDKTEQWSKLPPETKDHAVDLIQKGSGCRDGGQERAVHGSGQPKWAVRGKRGRTRWKWGAWPWAQIVGVSVTSATAFLLQGYMRIQQFRKTDGSYGAWLHRDSSTW